LCAEWSTSAERRSARPRPLRLCPRPASRGRACTSMTSSGAAHRGRRSPQRLLRHGRGRRRCGPCGPPGDQPPVEAGPIGVDPDGVAAVAGRPEPVPACSLDSYCTTAMRRIVVRQRVQGPRDHGSVHVTEPSRFCRCSARTLRTEPYGTGSIRITKAAPTVLSRVNAAQADDPGRIHTRPTRLKPQGWRFDPCGLSDMACRPAEPPAC
jgi:hypothetical protein